ncbi:olfactory receptor 11A1-like [Spea bombifrons]|uniref:olfactory receptor 11A1-like n=1 Tax=Spea bombifrons TaxID=233779 RepID=UPI00234BBEBA|nr:olfactory receptor 11A1-like [Spea bombifrons]
MNLKNNATLLENETVTEFLLLGFEGLQHLKTLLSIIFVITYILTLSGNILIIILVSMSNRLQSPMYFFLSNLSLSEVAFTTNIVPYMLHNLLSEDVAISLPVCFTQYYVFSSMATTECMLFAIMSYDRYLAICNPLRYTSLMDVQFCVHLVSCAWFSGFIISMITLILLCKLNYCGPNVIDNFFCDLTPLIKLSCSDTALVEVESFLFAAVVTLFPFVFIITTYIIIILTIFMIPSATGRKKAFSTCSSHLAVVSTYYGTLITMYVFPSQEEIFNISKALSLLYTVVTPLLNPIVYSLRNQEIHNALSTLLKNMMCLPKF